MDLAGMDFETLPFAGQWLGLIGCPTVPFQIMIYGLPSSGKSSLAIIFSKYIAEAFRLKVLFLAKEEGISGTIKEKFTRLNAINENIHIAEEMPESLDKYNVLVIDSINEMKMTPDDLRKIQNEYPELSTVQIFKATKSGKYLGLSDFSHMCQVEIQCVDGKAQAQKNRFGGNELLEIDSLSLDEKNGIMGYKWKPSASAKKEFAEKMKNDADFRNDYGQRKIDRAEKKRSGSQFDYETAGGEYVATKAQYDFCMKNMHLFESSEENVAANMVISSYTNKEKTKHDYIHIVNEMIRKNLK